VIGEPTITKEEFEVDYAAMSGMTVQELHEKFHLHAVRCDCGDYPPCRGWKMVSEEKETKP